MAQDRRRGGRLLMAGGVLLAAASLVVLIVVEPGAAQATGAIRTGAVSGFVAGVVVAVSGALPARKPPSVWHSRWYGVLLLAVGCMIALAGLMEEPSPDWLVTAGGTLMLVAGTGIVVAARSNPGRAGSS